MRYAFALALMLSGLSARSWAVDEFRLGGTEPWAEWTWQNRMMDDTTDPSVLQPRELKPGENLLPQLGPWYRWRSPGESTYRLGDVRIWRGINYLRPRAEPRDFVDGDIATFFSAHDYYDPNEFYTIDLGVPAPVDRFAFYPPEGRDALTQEPYRPNFAFAKYELSGSLDPVGVAKEEGSHYRPLDVLLASVDLNTEAVVHIEFPLQYLRFLRVVFFPDNGRFYTKFALAELEVSGRGFPPQAVWTSQVIDLGQTVNIGRGRFGASKWRRDGDQLVAAPDAPTSVQVEIKTGLDPTPIGYHGYDDIGQLVEVTQSAYERLKQRIWPWDPPAVGWRGPIIDDADNWSFWSPPLRHSGELPRVPSGRYLQLRLTLATETLWEFTRLDSLAIEYSPLLVERVVGEVAAASDLQPIGHIAEVPAGQKIELVCALRAEFTAEQAGFDAVRLTLPNAGVLLGLEMGDPLQSVNADSVIAEPEGLAIYLPEPIRDGGAQTLRLHLETVMYTASGTVQAEVFARAEQSLPQQVEEGDASDALGTNQLRMVAIGGALDEVLGAIEVQPTAFTPQGDGINDHVTIQYNLFRLLTPAEVELEIYALDGRSTWRQTLGVQLNGRHQVMWNGRDEDDQLVAPGIYVVQVRAQTDQGQWAQEHSLAVVY
ncbi:MAG: hypothetical protein F4X17_12745 [Gemmatimonadetes bacterium]|nr:hypothetical protein [Gemmatimonadota bacterium]